jgi:hypothetical protein
MSGAPIINIQGGSYPKKKVPVVQSAVTPTTTRITNSSSLLVSNNTSLAKKELLRYRPGSSLLTNKMPEMAGGGGRRFKRRMNMSVQQQNVPDSSGRNLEYVSVQIPYPTNKMRVLKVKALEQRSSNQGSNATLISIKKMKENSNKYSNIIIARNKKTNPSDMLRSL